MTHQIDDWTNCYDLGWQKIIHPAAYSHPAKFSRGLITHIIRHALDSGYIRPGAVVVDPFGGQAGGALPCMENGLHWVGVELESKFCEVGQGSDCTGISKENWIRFYSRWEKSSSVDGLHFCPDCLAEARRIIGEVKDKPRSQAQAHRRKRIAFLAKKHNRPLRLYPASPLPGTRAEIQKTFTMADSGGSYRRNSGQIPSTGAHRFSGNIERWEKMFSHLSGSAVLLQGDSRRLAEVIANAGLVIGSPPFQGSLNDGLSQTDRDKYAPLARNGRGVGTDYGSTPGQLAVLPPGSIEAVIASPPFAGNTGGRGEASRNGIDAALFDRHSGGMKKGTGDDPANLDHLPVGTLMISSPPYAESLKSETEEQTARKQARIARSKTLYDGRNLEVPSAGKAALGGGYGITPGQLGMMKPGDVDAIIASPPFTDSVGSDDPDKRGGLYRDEKRRNDVNLTGNYGQTPGQLGAMKAGELAVVGSPPYGGSIDHAAGNKNWTGKMSGNIKQWDYGTTENVGNLNGETFWSAARLIVEQCALLLPPGAAAIFVTKRYIKNGQIVDFTGQWIQLCEACGFRLEHHHRAWLVKDNGKQSTLDGELIDLKVERKSFFRRLSERRGSPKIDWEDVTCFVRV